MRPLIYAYLRAREGASEQDDAQVRRELTAHAQREGFTVAEIFVEQPWLSGPTAVDALVETISQTGVRDVVVPSLNHFSRAGQHASLEKAVIEKQIGAQIWSLHR